MESSELDHDVVGCLKTVQQNIQSVVVNNKLPQKAFLCAVSKRKPIELIQKCFDVGQIDFGENYVQELVDKAPVLPEKIRWHFIGHLQSKKCKYLAKIPNLYMVHTIDSIKLANKFNDALSNQKRDPLKVLVQIKTSQEETKHGISKDEYFNLIEHILKNCTFLQFCGLMTIGEYGSLEPFGIMQQLRKDVAQKFKLNEQELELSMGMTADYDEALKKGATIIRIGTAIFGQRIYKPKVQPQPNSQPKVKKSNPEQYAEKFMIYQMNNNLN